MSRRNWTGGVVGPVVIAVVGLLAWANCFTGPFVFDDRPAILANPSLDHFTTALTPPHDGGTVAGRPLVNLSLWLNRVISGTEPWSYHAFNLVIHLGAGLVLFGLVRRTLLLNAGGDGDAGLGEPTSAPTAGSARLTTTARANSIGFMAALLWTVHPLQTAAVTYTVQRAEALAALCVLVTLYGFVRAVGPRLRAPIPRAEEARASAAVRGPQEEARASAALWVSVVACLVGMATKETAVVAPVLVALYDWIFVRRGLSRSDGQAGIAAPRVGPWAGYYVALAASWLLLVALVMMNDARSGTAGFGSKIGVPEYVATQCAAIVRYLRLVFWPRDLVFDYGTATVAGFGTVLPQLLVILTLLALTLALLRRAPRAGFLGAAFFLLLAPSSSVVPVATQTMAEHRMYLPLAAITIGVALLLDRMLQRRAPWVAIALAVPLAVVVHARNRDYASAVGLWSDTVAKRPQNPRAHTHLGNALTQAGRAGEALTHYQEAARLAPEVASARNNLANALAAAGRIDEALPHYEAALRLDPQLATAELNLAQALTRVGRAADALPHYAAAEKAGVLDAASRYNYGVALARTRQFEAAIGQFRATLREDAGHVGALVNLGNVLLLTRRTDEAIAAYESALRLRPDDPQIQRNLAQARAMARQAAAGLE